MAKNNRYIPLIVGIAAAIGVLIGGKLNFTDTSDRLFTTNSKKDKLNRLIDYIDYEYVEDVNTDSIVDVTVNGILDNLDPHSTYIPKEDLKSITESMRGDFIGIGISFYTYNDTIAVIKPVENGPCDRAGILSGDRLLMADNDTLYGHAITNDDILSALKGKVNSEVKLTVYRKETDEILQFNIKRAPIPIKSVDAYYMLTDDLGYVKMNRFSEKSFREFKNALKELKRQGAKQLALDLRDNPGGFLGVAEQIVDEFLEKDKLILFTKNKRDQIERAYATRRGDFEDGEVFVLINENSASASEVIAGALQDNDKGIIVGRRSYGKGLVQREMALGDGSAVRLTVSRYYTPTGRSIQRPYDKGNKSYFNDYYKRIRNGELSDSSNIKVADSLKFTTPKGKIVYGGGGIIPDIFVPLDYTHENETLDYLERRNYFDFFVFELLDKDRLAYDELGRFEFINAFQISNRIFKDFQDFVNTRERTNFTFKAYNTAIRQRIKAAIAKQVYDDNAYFEVLDKNDDMIEEVISLSQAHPTLTQ